MMLGTGHFVKEDEAKPLLQSDVVHRGTHELRLGRAGRRGTRQAYTNWQAGKGLIGGDPYRRAGSHLLPAWGLDQPFFRALALDDPRVERRPGGAALTSAPRHSK